MSLKQAFKDLEESITRLKKDLLILVILSLFAFGLVVGILVGLFIGRGG